MWAAFADEWTLRPPVHWLVAGFIEYEPPHKAVLAAGPQSGQQYMTAEAAKEWFERTGGVIEGVRKI
jgi:hypothetical protein